MKLHRPSSTHDSVWLLAWASLYVLLISSFVAKAEAPVFRAGPVTAETPEAERIRGSDAIAGLGDWHLSNGTLCAAVLGVEHHGQLVPGGGNLVDLGHCGRDDDQWVGLEPMYNLSRAEMFRITRIEAHTGDHAAEIVTFAEDAGLELTTRYRVDAVQPNRLEVQTRVIRVRAGPRFFSQSDILIHTVSALRNFISNDGGHYSGFRHTSRTESSYLTIASAIREAQGVVLVGSDDQGPPISYLYRVTKSIAVDRNGDAETVTGHTIGFSSISLTHFGSQPSWHGGTTPSLLGALGLLFADLSIGEHFELDREIWLSKRGDVASLTDRLFTEPRIEAQAHGEQASVLVTGRVSDRETRVHVFRTGDGPTSHITMARPDAMGRLSFHLPRADYRFEFLAPGGRKIVREVALSTEESSFDLGAVALSQNARVLLPAGSPMRLVFRGEAETPDPVFGDDLTGLRLNGEPKLNSHATSDVHLSGESVDPHDIELAAGRYRVFATRGPEFSLSKAKLEVSAGEVVNLEIEPPTRLLETTGWISADFHVHSARSFDSTLAPSARLRSFVAEGAEVLIATEHDVVSDYSGMIDEFGLGDHVTGLTGLEVTTISPTPNNPFTTGHLNLFPVPYRPDSNRGGALQDEGLRLREIIALARALPDSPIVQINHPRTFDPNELDEAFFDHLSVTGTPFDPGLALGAAANRSLIDADPRTGLRDVDFDALELMNGKKIENYRVVLRDWFSLLAQGHRVSGMANSDSHQLSTIVAVPRNYVRFEPAGDEAFDSNRFFAAVRNGHLYGTSGPLLDVHLAGAGPGDRFGGRTGKLSVIVRAAPWVPVSTLRIHVDGRVVAERAIQFSDTEAVGAVRVNAQSIDLRFEADAFVVVEVEGPSQGDYAEVLPGFVPHAFINPIFVDADQDGRWTPPGLTSH